MASQQFEAQSAAAAVSGSSSSSAVAANASSQIADLSYRNYDGPLQTRLARWWIVTMATFRANLHRKRGGYWIPAALIVFIYLIRGAIFYFGQTFRERFGGGQEDINFYALALYDTLTGTAILLFAAALSIGAASIAADNRANALLVYLSKPLTRVDYLLGKWVGLFLMLFALTVIPATLMYLFFVTAYWNADFLKQNPWLFFRLVGACAIPAALHASLILGFSAWSKNPRTAGAVYAAFYFILNIFAGLGANLMIQRDVKSNQAAQAALVRSLSVDGLSSSLAQHVYGVTPSQALRQFTGGRRRGRRDPTPEQEEDGGSFAVPERAPLLPLLGIAGLFIVLPLVAASVKVRAVEVITG